MLSCFSRAWLCATLWTVALQAPLSTRFSRQEFWSGLPFPSPAHPSILLQSPSLSSLNHTTNSHWLFIPLSLFSTSDKRSSSLLPTVLSALTEWGSFADWKLSKYMEQTLTQEEGGVYGLLLSHTSLLGKCKGKVSRATILDSKLHAAMVNLMCELG